MISLTEKSFSTYKNFKFQLKWNERYVAGFSKITLLDTTSGIVDHREEGEPNHITKIPAHRKYDSVTLERGITYDQEFEKWIKNGFLSCPAREIFIDVYNEADQKVLSYKFFRCWVSEQQSIPELNANSNGVIIEHMKLENEGFERIS